MDMQKIKQFSDMREDLKNLGVIGLSVWDTSIHMSVGALLELPGLKVEGCDSEDYPYSLYTVLEGINFHSIFGDGDIKRHPILATLIKQSEVI